MNAVWKVQCPDVANTVSLPLVRWLHFDLQHGVPTAWALVEPNDPPADYTITVVGTGHPVDATGEYLGTVLMMGDTLVLHAFARPVDAVSFPNEVTPTELSYDDPRR